MQKGQYIASAFRVWIRTFGGYKKVGDAIGVQRATVWGWAQGTMPSDEKIKALVRVSRGALTREVIIKSCEYEKKITESGLSRGTRFDRARPPMPD